MSAVEWSKEEGTLGAARYLWDFYVYNAKKQLIGKFVNAILTEAEAWSTSEALKKEHVGAVCAVQKSKVSGPPRAPIKSPDLAPPPPGTACKWTPVFPGMTFDVKFPPKQVPQTRKSLTPNAPLGPISPTPLDTSFLRPQPVAASAAAKSEFVQPTYPRNPFTRTSVNGVEWLGAVQDTPGYKACLGNLIKKCESQYQAAIVELDAKLLAAAANNDDAEYNSLVAQKNAQKTHRDTCFKQAENICLLQGTTAANTNLTPAQVTKLQNDINTFFSSMVDGPCKVGVDGNIGGETCGAAVFAVANGATHISVPGECAKIASTYSSDGCKAGAGGGKSVPALCDDAKCPPGQECCRNWEWCQNNTCVNKCPEGYVRGADGFCALAKAASSGDSGGNWGLVLLAGAAVGAIFLGIRAPKNLPPRAAERGVAENPRKQAGYAILVWDRPDGGYTVAARARNRSDAVYKKKLVQAEFPQYAVTFVSTKKRRRAA